MDVFHKVLSRIYSDSGGRETAKVDMGEILKQEGFFPSREEIASHMIKEGWITAADNNYAVFITHWGIAEAKKTINNVPDNSRAVEKDTKQLVSSAKQFSVVSEEFAGNLSKSSLSLVEKQYSELGALIDKIKSQIG